MKKTGGWKYLILAMLAFAGLGMEVILAFFLEPLIYQAPMQSWTDLQNISHWVITCAVWGLLSWGIVRFARKRYGYDLFERKDSPAAWRWAIVAVLVIAGLALPIHSFAHVTYFTIRSGGRTLITFLFDAVYTWVVTVLLAWLLCTYTDWPVDKIYFCVQFIDVIKIVIGLLMLRSDFWARNVVSDV